jgi:uncharacterized iron-regulated protein
MRKILIIVLSLALFPSALLAASRQAHSTSGPGYIPQRVYDSRDKEFTDFETMLARLAQADVVFVGEQHDDFATHRLEAALLEGIARRRSSVIVALEMFERDTQKTLDDYLAGRITEAEFLKNSRPWPNYATDYRPLVEFAKAKGWRVVAANIPRRYASQVARGGLQILDAVPANEKPWIARQINCPRDDYYKRFVETVGSHPGSGGDSKSEAEQKAMMDRFYHAQCIKDETMAESVAEAQASTDQSKPLIIHYNGSFHSDYKLGTAARAKQRMPKARIAVVSMVPVENLDNIDAGDYRKRADYIVFTLRPPKDQSNKP